MRFVMGDGSVEVAVDNAIDYSLNNWFFTTGIYRVNTMLAFKSGKLLPNTGTNSYAYENDYPARLGSSDGSSPLPMIGKISNALIYSLADYAPRILSRSIETRRN